MLGAAGTLALAAYVGRISWRIAPIAYGSPVYMHEWVDALRLASTECWEWGWHHAESGATAHGPFCMADVQAQS